MKNNYVVMITPNIKQGFSALKYLAKELSKHNVFIKLLPKKEFDAYTKLLGNKK